MSKPGDLFQFPFPSVSTPSAGAAGEGPVPAAGTAPLSCEPLTADELVEVRALLQLWGPGWSLRVREALAAASCGVVGVAPQVAAGHGGGTLPPFPPPLPDSTETARAGHGAGARPATLMPPGLPAFNGSPNGAAMPGFVVPQIETVPVDPTAEATPGAVSSSDALSANTVLRVFDAVAIGAAEREHAAALRAALAAVDVPEFIGPATAAVLGVFPLGQTLRHGTPEQRLFTLNALGDRFLAQLAGLTFSSRRQLLKAAAAFLSAASEYYVFLSHEGEPFDAQHHERVAEGGSGGRTVREMRSFLVVRRQGDQVVRLAQVLT